MTLPWCLVWPTLMLVGFAAYQVRALLRRRRMDTDGIPPPRPSALARDWSEEVLRRHYPAAAVPRLVDSRVPLPTARRPPWWRPLRRARWARRVDLAIGAAALVGWRQPLSWLTKTPAPRPPRYVQPVRTVVADSAIDKLRKVGEQIATESGLYVADICTAEGDDHTVFFIGPPMRRITLRNSLGIDLEAGGAMDQEARRVILREFSGEPVEGKERS